MPEKTPGKVPVKMPAKMEMFAREYLIDLNATEAARRAGYRGSDAVLSNMGYKLLKRADVQAIVRAGHDERTKKVGVTAERVIAELAAIAFVRPLDCVGANGEIRELSDEAKAAVESVSVVNDKDGRSMTVVKFWNKNKALAELRAHFEAAKVNAPGAIGSNVLATLGALSDEVLQARLKDFEKKNGA
jgi:phage terminase small subunit